MITNPPQGGKTCILKYGGTSVGKFLPKIVDNAIDAITNHQDRLVLVCSARSGSTKATGTTNLLLRAAAEALRPKPQDLSSSIPSLLNSPTGSPFPGPGTPRARTPTSGLSNSLASLRLERFATGQGMGEEKQLFDDTVDQIKLDHLKALREVVRNDDEVLKETEEEIEYDCERLRGFLRAAQIIDEISTRSKDIIMGVGERLSCRIVAAALRDRGIDAELVSLESIIDWDVLAEDPSAAGDAKSTDGPPQLGQEFYSKLSQRLGDRLRECGDRVPVVTGFFGVVPGSLLAQVGRGYSDLCAALCAVGLSASELQVWKEVDGIFTADPRKVPTARLLPTITPEEAAELTYYGSEVIHPFTMEQVIRAAIPIRIKNVERPLGAGTVIFPDALGPGTEEPAEGLTAKLAIAPSTAPSIPSSLPSSTLEPHLGPTAITIKDTVVVLSVHSNRKTISHGFFARIFGVLDKYGIVVDLISTSEVHVSMAIHGEIRKGTLDRVTRDLKVVGEVTLSRDMAILSLVGKHMKNMVGTAGKMFTTLAEGNINIEMISQGASEIKFVPFALSLFSCPPADLFPLPTSVLLFHLSPSVPRRRPHLTSMHSISCVIEERDAVKALNLVHLKLLH
ncbi:hypothetical protein JCM11641_006472 [Rhodosporidiobolus odoratus]